MNCSGRGIVLGELGERRQIVKYFPLQQQKRNKVEGSRGNGDPVLWWSISAAANGWSE